MASLLGFADSKVKQVVNRADSARHARLGADLGPLPDPWPHGEPLRVGDRVAFTSCDEAQRLRLEQRAEELGVRVISSVSRLTVMLITDGSFSGGKLAKAQELRIRHVHTDVFETLLHHLQPAAVSAAAGSAPAHLRKRAHDTSVGSPIKAARSAVRAWAAANGFDLGTSGRLLKHVMDAYAAAH